MISVCIPTFNGEKFIRIQLESILSQLGNDDEIVISDDSSADKTVEIIKSFNDSRIHLLANNSFHSPIYNLENALKNAKGDFIFLSDQDDEWTMDKVSVCMEKLKDCDLLIHDADIVDGNGNQTAESFFKLNHTKKGKFYNLLKNGYHGCCMCFSKELCEALLPFPKELPMHDSYIGNFAAFNGYKVKFTDEKLLHYRRHNSNASNSSEKSSRPFFARLKDRIILLKSIKK